MTNELEEIRDILAEEENVVDETNKDDSSAPQTYNISSYGADFDVDGLVKRLNRELIFIPPFQRDYVWNLNDASRLIESLLLGLPVPGIFLAKEPESEKLLVIDGQQRLKTLQFFLGGYFNPKPDQKNRRVFKLTKVQPQFEGKTYEELDQKDQIKLSDTIIHATIIKQESPVGDDTSVYHVFERLNTGGRKLTPQEIRTAIFHGDFVNLLKELNALPAWRNIFGKESNRLKDRELILRFMALYYNGENYSKPMNEFLNKFNKKHRYANADFISKSTDLFTATISAIHDAIGSKAFRPERALNAAVFDAVMIAIARRISSGGAAINLGSLKSAYDDLLNNNTKFKEKISDSTSDATNVQERLRIATSVFSGI